MTGRIPSRTNNAGSLMGVWAGARAEADSRRETKYVATAAIKHQRLRKAKPAQLVALAKAFSSATPPELISATPKSLPGANYQACSLNGTVFVKSTPLVPHAIGTWFVAGTVIH